MKVKSIKLKTYPSSNTRIRRVSRINLGEKYNRERSRSKIFAPRPSPTFVDDRENAGKRIKTTRKSRRYRVRRSHYDEFRARRLFPEAILETREMAKFTFRPAKLRRRIQYIPKRFERDSTRRRAAETGRDLIYRSYRGGDRNRATLTSPAGIERGKRKRCMFLSSFTIKCRKVFRRIFPRFSHGG